MRIAEKISEIEKTIQTFLVFARNMGWRYISHPTHLKSFQLFLEKSGIDCFEAVTPTHLFDYQQNLLADRSAITVNGYISSLRALWRFLIRQQKVTHNPTLALPRLQAEYFTPYLYSPRELFLIDEAYKKAVQEAPSFYPQLIPSVRWTMFRLMADCGLRVSETIRLTLDDIDRQGRSLRIERTKFLKTRVIPIPRSTHRRLELYLGLRADSRLKASATQALFISIHANPLSRSHVEQDFKALLYKMGLYRPKRREGRMVFGSSNLHALRHSFAVRCLEKWQAQGRNVDHLLPLLSSYMGHVEVSYTKTYLHLTPRLRETASVRLEAFSRGSKNKPSQGHPPRGEPISH